MFGFSAVIHNPSAFRELFPAVVSDGKHLYDEPVRTSTLRNLNFPEADFWDTILCQFFVHLAKQVDSYVWRDDRCAAFFHGARLTRPVNFVADASNLEAPRSKSVNITGGVYGVPLAVSRRRRRSGFHG